MRLSKSESDHTIVITPGEPAGIGMDVCLASDSLLPEALKRIYLADPEALVARADLLGINCPLRVLASPKDYAPGKLNVIPCELGYTVKAGKIDIDRLTRTFVQRGIHRSLRHQPEPQHREGRQQGGGGDQPGKNGTCR